MPLPHERLLSKARTLLADGEFDYAIVAAQTACEIAIARAMRRLVAAQAAHLQTNIEALLVGRYSLSDKRVSSLWDSLAVDSIRSEAFWEPYVEHRARRNAIVHQGTTYALAEAKSSIQVAEGLCLHVTKGAP